MHGTVRFLYLSHLRVWNICKNLHVIKHWTGLVWTGLIKHGLIKHGVIKHGLIKREVMKHGLIKHTLIKHGVINTVKNKRRASLIRAE